MSRLHGAKQLIPAADWKNARWTPVPLPADELIDALLAPSRLDALLACDSQLLTYDPESFLMVLVPWGRNLRAVAAPIATVMTSAIVFALILPAKAEGEPGDAPSGFLHGLLESIAATVSPLLGAVSFMLVFRLGRAAVRYWEARAAAGKMVEKLRVLAAHFMLHGRGALLERDCALRWCGVFAIATKNYLRPMRDHGKCTRMDELQVIANL
ncbi:hypothetical protein T492DRAFT_859176 [Pavlovales sp. CCMP2436]|nr:hypothetical protein T492DRAFT_859176 [Pavlovales sp. CCMP2436]